MLHPELGDAADPIPLSGVLGDSLPLRRVQDGVMLPGQPACDGNLADIVTARILVWEHTTSIVITWVVEHGAQSSVTVPVADNTVMLEARNARHEYTRTVTLERAPKWPLATINNP